jgi:hypothetical protein
MRTEGKNTFRHTTLPQSKHRRPPLPPQRMQEARKRQHTPPSATRHPRLPIPPHHTLTCCAPHAHPLLPAATAFVPYGFVLVQVQVLFLNRKTGTSEVIVCPGLFVARIIDVAVAGSPISGMLAVRRGSSGLGELELELELIQTRMIQKPLLWVEVGKSACVLVGICELRLSLPARYDPQCSSLLDFLSVCLVRVLWIVGLRNFLHRVLNRPRPIIELSSF